MSRSAVDFKHLQTGLDSDEAKQTQKNEGPFLGPNLAGHTITHATFLDRNITFSVILQKMKYTLLNTITKTTFSV